ncbi:MAG: RIP metalloprotease RseP [Tahibacter sp.]
MADVFGSIWWLIVTLGLLVTFHEFGHYWVARRFGVKVLRFSIGFGKPLWSRIGKDGTEYVIAAIPLGGYVKFLDSRETDVTAEEKNQDFSRKPIWQRVLVVLAGPAFNLIFTVAALWAMFVVGKPDYQPIVGRSEGIAAQAGFADNDRIRRIDGESVSNWTDASMALLGAALDRKPIDVVVDDAAGAERTRRLALDKIPTDADETAAMRSIGLVPKQLIAEPAVGVISPGGAAEAADIRVNDRILALNGTPVNDWQKFVELIQSSSAADKALTLRIQRGTETLDVALQPRRNKDESGKESWKIGIGAKVSDAHYDALQHYGPIAAIPAALRETASLTRQTLGMLKRMLVGTASLKNVSGMISIAQYANESAKRGVAWFLNFLALISLSLFIMNLLPIPILDGGHLVYYLIESIKGSPVSERALIAGQYVGLVLLVALMGLAFYNDILRPFPS